MTFTLFTLATVSAFISAGVCAPPGSGMPFGGPPGGWGHNQNCLSGAQATSIVNQYADLLVHPTGPNFNTTAESLLADDFAVYSDSINILANRPLGGPSYPSKSIFIASQASTPPIPTLVTNEIFWTCNKIAWRWTGSGIGTNQSESKGMITMNVSPQNNNGQGQIDTVYSEFNTAAWYNDLGHPECKKTTT